MEEKDRQITARAAREGLAIKKEFGKENLNDMIDPLPPNVEKQQKTPKINAKELRKIDIDAEILKDAFKNLTSQWQKNIRQRNNLLQLNILLKSIFDYQEQYIFYSPHFLPKPQIFS